MKAIFGLWLMVVLGLELQLAAEDLSQMGPWQSAEGRTIEARVLSISAKAKTVELERSDGLRFTLPWRRLSETDQERLKASLEMPNSAVATSAPSRAEGSAPIKLPESVELKDVPMVKQKNNYCVPASAAMIANFHGIDTDQDQVADLSSEMSASNQGTYPSDMLLAMQKLGFKGRTLHWEKETDFFETALPRIRRALFETGPVYISFRTGVFGAMGHGCVIVGYDDRKEELLFHNPWGNTFKKDYKQVAIDAHGVVFIEAPEPAPVATEAFVGRIQAAAPKFEGDFLALTARLQSEGIPHKLVWCSRRDARSDKRFARDTARDDGRMILELAFERNPAVLIPYSEDGETRRYQFVTRPPEGGARFLVRSIDERGWGEPKLQTLGSLTRYWTTAFTPEYQTEKVWELPMIELQPVPGL